MVIEGSNEHSQSELASLREFDRFVSNSDSSNNVTH